MNHLILNRDFRLPDDGWYQIAPLGEYPHVGAGLIQVIDQEACVAMASRFAADAKIPNFAGLLVDFDHFSLDGEKRSEAAGWIIALEARCEGSGFGVRGSGGEDGSAGTPRPTQANEGLWAQIRWSDLGEAAVKGGRYRFLSPVWARTDCVDLGPDPQSGRDRVRPVRLLNAAVTNDPNLKGMRPLSNRSQESEARSQKEDGIGDVFEQKVAKNAKNTGSGSGANGESVDLLTFNRATNQSEGKGAVMKAVIEKLVNHLGLAADATEAVILEKLAGLPVLTVVTELQNSLSAARTELDALKGTLKGVEGELVNRHLEEFAGVVTEKTKEFWTGQLMTNRQAALAALTEFASERETGKEEPTPTPSPSTSSGQARKPLHNRATARPLPPGQAGAEGDGKAAKIRNRAHEIVAAEKVPFGVAFRRAEKEVVGQ